MVQPLLDQGLLKVKDEVFRVIEKAKIILSHNCSQRCLRRVKGAEDDGPKNLVCHKIHSDKDTSDCTVHQHIPMKLLLTLSYIEGHEKCGL